MTFLVLHDDFFFEKIIKLKLNQIKTRNYCVMIPPRCFTCNAVIGHKFTDFIKSKDDTGQYGSLLDEIGVKRICCRRMLLTHVEIVDEICKYSAVRTVLDESRTIFDSYVTNERTVSCD